MPCDSITTQALSEKLKNAMPALIKSAMQSEGFRITVDTATRIVGVNSIHTWSWEAGKGIRTEARTYDSRAAEAAQSQLVQSYSRAAVSWAAQRAGWTVQQTAPNKLTIQKR